MILNAIISAIVASAVAWIMTKFMMRRQRRAQAQRKKFVSEVFSAPGGLTLDERIRAKRAEIQKALDRGDHKRAHQLDREERALWNRVRD